MEPRIYLTESRYSVDFYWKERTREEGREGRNSIYPNKAVEEVMLVECFAQFLTHSEHSLNKDS